MSAAAYSARTWAEGKSLAEVQEEITRVQGKISHTYQWNEVGNAHDDYVREGTLKQIVVERRERAMREVA